MCYFASLLLQAQCVKVWESRVQAACWRQQAGQAGQSTEDEEDLPAVQESKENSPCVIHPAFGMQTTKPWSVGTAVVVHLEVLTVVLLCCIAAQPTEASYEQSAPLQNTVTESGLATGKLQEPWDPEVDALVAWTHELDENAL